MKTRTIVAALAVIAASSIAILAQTLTVTIRESPRATIRDTTKFQVDPFWPKPLPHDWVMADVGGVCVDAQDHLFLIERSADPIKLNPEQAIELGPPVIEYGLDGNVLNTWGDPKLIPTGAHSCYFDHAGNIWIGGQTDGIAQKYTRDGKLLLQIGTKMKFDSSDGTIKGEASSSSHELLNGPNGFAEDPANGDLYIADGERNHRVVVFDRNGKYLRQFGRLATKEEADADVGGVFKKTVHCIALSSDGLLYVCDREGKRIEVFDKMGNYKKSVYFASRRAGGPSRLEVYWLVFSRDTAQKYMYVGTSEGLVWTTDRESGQPISAFGRNGTMAGQFQVHDMAIDSKGTYLSANGPHAESRSLTWWGKIKR